MTSGTTGGAGALRARGGLPHLRGVPARAGGRVDPAHQASPAAGSADFLDDPYPVLAILRENYPCYRDWHGNAFWLTRYDDVTSVFVDDANFETRSKLWHYAMEGYGRDLRAELPVLVAQARGIDEQAGPVAEAILAELRPRGEADLALEVAARFPVELLARVLDLPAGDVGDFARRYWAMQRGIHWEPVAEAGRPGRHRRADRVLRAAGRGPAGRPGRRPRLGHRDARARQRTGHGRGRRGHAARGRPRDPPRQPGQPLVPAARRPRAAGPGHRGAAHGEARVPGGAAALPAGAGRPPLRPSRGRALRSTPAQGRPGDLLGRCRQPGPARVPQRPRRLRRAAQGPVPARAARPVPGRRPAHRHRLRARSALEAPGAARGPAPVALCHLPRHRGDGDEPAARRAPRSDVWRLAPARHCGRCASARCTPAGTCR